MLFSDVLLGTVLGAILWPIIQEVVDSANRAILGMILGGLAGGVIAWARIGLYAGMVIGAALGANTRPVDQDLGVAFIAALIATARGAAIGAIIILSLRSMSFVLVGAGIGLMVSLFLSGGLRLLNQMVLTRPVSDLQITLVVLFGTFISFAILSGRR